MTLKELRWNEMLLFVSQWDMWDRSLRQQGEWTLHQEGKYDRVFVKFRWNFIHFAKCQSTINARKQRFQQGSLSLKTNISRLSLEIQCLSDTRISKNDRACKLGRNHKKNCIQNYKHDSPVLVIVKINHYLQCLVK